jgi:hypothetical protein
MKKFYDIHFHAFNLSHPNILAFLSRVPWRLLLMTTAVSAPLMTLFSYDKKIKNLLTMLENDIGNYFLMVDYYLRQSPFLRGNYIGNLYDQKWSTRYHKIVVCPLIMDFGYKNIISKTFYRIPAQKPIIEQTCDLMNGINFYNNQTLQVSFDTPVPKCSYIPDDKENKLLEIYPFIGLNTGNYTIKSVVSILDEFFGDYDGKIETLCENMGTKAGFAGIKVYPPLGFDPFPEGNNAEMEKVDYLYSYCVKKNIPITTHCSDGGFAVCDEARDYTNPAKWRKVLERYPDLKINFAHMGKQNKKKFILFSQSAWQKEVISLIEKYPNAYTDFSCTAFDDEFYAGLAGLLKDNPRIGEKMLFGSDFMINLLWVESYNSYLETFWQTKQITAEVKDLFCSTNPERFLFGTAKGGSE